MNLHKQEFTQKTLTFTQKENTSSVLIFFIDISHIYFEIACYLVD